MLNFTVGPVQSCEKVLAIGAEQIPYFRTPEFSEMMFENEILMKKFSYAGEDARVVFLTGSGTAAMEAVVINCLTKQSKTLIVNGGSFGERFVLLCKIHRIPYEEIKLETGKTLTEEMLRPYENRGFSDLLVNAHETSTGVCYDMRLIHNFCKRNHCFFIVDAISSFLADEFCMRDLECDVMITGSQKALACSPGASAIVLSGRAVDRIYHANVKSLYFNLRNALEDGKRGQTPFTPAVGIFRQIYTRLKEIEKKGGAETEIKKTADLAKDFRERMEKSMLPFQYVAETKSNAVTSLRTMEGVSAYHIFTVLKNEYHIWVCPNGGELKDTVFRVGHLGELTAEDNKRLIDALMDMKQRGLLGRSFND